MRGPRGSAGRECRGPRPRRLSCGARGGRGGASGVKAGVAELSRGENPREPKLKVYFTAVGFYDALVAAPSQKAALKAWGTSTDLFAAGRAIVVEDTAEQKEALATPGQVIKRLRAGQAEMLAEVEREREREKAERAGAKRQAKIAREKAPAPLPDRSELDAVERAIAAAEAQLAERLETIAAERAELEALEAAVRSEREFKLKELGRTRVRLHLAYDRAMVKRRPQRQL